MKTFALLIIGGILVLLGGLWLFQGLDLVRLEPIACVANCQPIRGGSPTWAAVGAAVAAAGAGVIFIALRRRRRI